jgi:hypothetical protein
MGLNSPLQSHCSPSRPEHLHQNHIVDVCLTADLRGPHRDAVPMMPWSGLSSASAEHANEMGTSEVPHWTSIMWQSSR